MNLGYWHIPVHIGSSSCFCIRRCLHTKKKTEKLYEEAWNNWFWNTIIGELVVFDKGYFAIDSLESHQHRILANRSEIHNYN